MGIVGLGRIGKAVARRAEAFGMRIVYYGRRRVPDTAYPFYDDLAVMARDSDYLMLTCPGGEATRNLIDAKVIAALGPEGMLVNIARGSVVDQPALIAALQSRQLGGAALDVYADEPRLPEALMRLDNVVLAPHRQRHACDAARDGRSHGRQSIGAFRRQKIADAGDLIRRRATCPIAELGGAKFLSPRPDGCLAATRSRPHARVGRRVSALQQAHRHRYRG